MRKYGFDLLENVPQSIDCGTFNLVCNIIHNEWLKLGSHITNLDLNHQDSIYKNMPLKIKRNLFNAV